MKTILIIITLQGTVATPEFNTEEACHHARDYIREHYVNRYVRSDCFPKGIGETVLEKREDRLSE